MGYTTSHWFFSICPQTSSILFSAPYFAPQKLASPQLPCRMDCCSGLANGRRNWKLRVEESGRVFPCGSDARTLEAVDWSPTVLQLPPSFITLLPTCVLPALGSDGSLGRLVSVCLLIPCSYSDIAHTSIMAPSSTFLRLNPQNQVLFLNLPKSMHMSLRKTWASGSWLFLEVFWDSLFVRNERTRTLDP